MEDNYTGLVNRIDWVVSARVLERIAPIEKGWPTYLRDEELVAWYRQFRFFGLFLAGNPFPSPDQVVALEAVEDCLLAVAHEARGRPLIRNLRLAPHRKPVEELTRPNSRDEEWRPHIGRARELTDVDENAIIVGWLRGTPLLAMARAIAMGVRPQESDEPNFDSWLAEVESSRRRPGRPRADDTPASNKPDPWVLRRYARRVGRTIQARRFMDKVANCVAVKISSQWPVPLN